MEQYVFKIAIDYRGHLWKGSASFNGTEVIYNKNYYFKEQKHFFEHCWRVEKMKGFKIALFFCLFF